jgi:hypothetical protein
VSDYDWSEHYTTKVYNSGRQTWRMRSAAAEWVRANNPPAVVLNTDVPLAGVVLTGEMLAWLLVEFGKRHPLSEVTKHLPEVANG